MNINQTNRILLGGIAIIGCGLGYFSLNGSNEQAYQTEQAFSQSNSWVVTASNEAETDQPSAVQQAIFTNSGDFDNNGEVIQDSNIRLCQGVAECTACAGGAAPFAQQAGHVQHAGHVQGEFVQGGFAQTGHTGFAQAAFAQPSQTQGVPYTPRATPTGFKSNRQQYLTAGVKHFAGVDENTPPDNSGEPRWKDADYVPWEAFAYGEYIGPHRHPHVAEYRLRVDDELEFVYILTRERSTESYRFYVGDTISITSAIDDSIDQDEVTILGDGTISLSLIGQVRVSGKTVRDLQRELNDRYAKFFQNPSVVVQVLQGDTPLQDLLDSVDARAGQGAACLQSDLHSKKSLVKLTLVIVHVFAVLKSLLFLPNVLQDSSTLLVKCFKRDSLN